MKKIALILGLMCIITAPVFAEDIILEGVKPEQIELPKNNVNLKGSLMIQDDTALQEIINKQREKDLEDIEILH